MSTLIIHPESRNQTIYSQQLTFDDSGKYKCVVRNDTHVLQHEVQLEVSGNWNYFYGFTENDKNKDVNYTACVIFLLSGPSISIGWPKTTYKPRDQKANHGDFARFYCEAFVGMILLLLLLLLSSLIITTIRLNLCRSFCQHLFQVSIQRNKCLMDVFRLVIA